MKLFFLSIFLLAMLIGCSTTSNTTLVNENYTGKQNTPKELVIFPFLYDSLKILNWDDVVDDFEVDSANSKSFIYDTLSKSLLINSKSCTRLLTIIDGKKLFDWNTMIKDKNNYQQINQKIDKKYNATFLIPKKELLTEEHSNSYALIINRITIARNIERLPGTMAYTPGQTVSTPGGTFQTPGHWSSGWTPENLGAKTEFIIWDYEKNDYVKFGFITSKEEFSFSMTSGIWMDLFKTIPLDIYEDTPFGISPVNYYYKK
jgi:hypothetical protein